MAAIVLVILVAPLVIGVAVDTRLGVWPWGMVLALMVAILAATVFTVRATLAAYQRLEQPHAQAESNRTKLHIKEDQRA